MTTFVESGDFIKIFVVSRQKEKFYKILLVH